MGDYKFSVNSNVGAVSSVDFTVSTTSSALYYSPATVQDHTSAMQDDLIIEKSSVKSQLSNAVSDINGDQILKKEDDSSAGNVGNGIQCDKSNEQATIIPVVSAPLQLPAPYNVSEPSPNVINSTNTSTASLWSTGPMDDAILHSLNVPAINGSLAFQNFPPATPNLYNTSIGPQMAGLPQSQAQQRRAITATHNFPRHIQQQSHPQNMFMANKGYTSWSNPQQNTWSPAPQNQANLTAGLSPWNRGRSVPNLNPLQSVANRKPSPTFNHQHSGMVISPKFRRSTSYPGKGMFPQPPTFEISNMEENRPDLLLPYQQSSGLSASFLSEIEPSYLPPCTEEDASRYGANYGLKDRAVGNGTSGVPGPLDNMRNLEHYLNDIMRAAPETSDHHLKDELGQDQRLRAQLGSTNIQKAGFGAMGHEVKVWHCTGYSGTFGVQPTVLDQPDQGMWPPQNTVDNGSGDSARKDMDVRLMNTWPEYAPPNTFYVDEAVPFWSDAQGETNGVNRMNGVNFPFGAPAPSPEIFRRKCYRNLAQDNLENPHRNGVNRMNGVGTNRGSQHGPMELN